MSREIKFSYMFFTENNKFVCEKIFTLKDIEHGAYPLFYFGIICDKTKTIRRRYIGLKDKNGKEIYEGDIVNMSKRYVKIGWNKFLACFEFQNLDGSSYMTFSDNIEVIGNIYEHKSLLI